MEVAFARPREPLNWVMLKELRPLHVLGLTCGEREVLWTGLSHMGVQSMHLTISMGTIHGVWCDWLLELGSMHHYVYNQVALPLPPVPGSLSVLFFLFYL